MLSGRRELDASGLIVAPGFINLHSHSDWVLPVPDHEQVLAPLVLQGITTIVAGQCGFSPSPVTEESIRPLDTTTKILQDAPCDHLGLRLR